MKARSSHKAVAALALLFAAGAAAVAAPAWSGSRRAGQGPLSPRQVVDTFDDLVLAHKPRQAIERFIAPDFIEHDPLVPVDGKDSLIRYMAEQGWESNGNAQMRDIVDRTIAEGDMVVVHHHIFRRPGDRAQVFVDIFRVSGGLIHEHWDVMQEAPEHSDNRHTMY